MQEKTNSSEIIENTSQEKLKKEISDNQRKDTQEDSNSEKEK